jgi:succinyl-CoA synthetase alpha subunit
MSVLVDKNTKVICQGFTGSGLTAVAADNLSDAAEKIVKAVKG